MNCLIWKQANSAVEIFNVESWCEINRISKPEQNHSFVHCDPSLVFVLFQALRCQTNRPFLDASLSRKTLILMVRKSERSQPGSGFTAMTGILLCPTENRGNIVLFTASFVPRHAVTFTSTCTLVSAPLHAYGEEQTGFMATAG